MSEIKFVNGLKVERHPKAPEWVVASLSFKVDEIVKWLQENNQGGYVKADIKMSKKGSMYAALNDWQPQKKVQGQLDSFEQATLSEAESDEVPF